MTTTEAQELQHRLTLRMERRHRHLAERRAAGLEHDGRQEAEITPRRLRRAKKSYNARFLARALRQDNGEGYRLHHGSSVEPNAGDLVLARVQTLGQHKRLEAHNSRRRFLFQGDEVVVVYGNRYAPDQFLAEVPRNLNFTNLVAAGGMAGRVIDKHAAIGNATVLEPLGLIGDRQGVLNLGRIAPARVNGWEEAWQEFTSADKRPVVVIVFGSSMNSGKSTTVGCLVNGLVNAGYEVNAGKATGTGAGNDAGLFRDSGADRVLDFTDFGLVSTYQLSVDQVKNVVFSMVNELSREAPDAVIIEIADGIYQGETAALLRDPDFAKLTDVVLFACGEALSAAAGVALLQQAGLPLAAVSGLLTGSPLISAEAAAVVDVPVIPTFDLCFPEVARGLTGL